jgi:integrase
MTTWELPGARTKNRRPHVVHLAAPVRAEVRKAARIEGAALVFTTTGETGVSGFEKAKQRLQAAIVAERLKIAAETGATAAPLDPWVPHDFRRTGVTLMASQVSIMPLLTRC